MKTNANAYLALMQWSLIRHKFYIMAFVMVQIVLSLAIIYGFTFITNASDDISQTYLCTGAMTINILAVTCVLAPQIVTESKQNGVLNYQRTLPISRLGILLSDLLVWAILSLPGIVVSLIIAALNFNMSVYLNWESIASVLFVISSLILFGFAIAYLLPPNMVGLITQVIMLGGLLFSPILYSIDRLPDWMSEIHKYLPFVSVSNIIRSTLFHMQDTQSWDYTIIFIWGSIAFVIGMLVLTRRD